MATVNVKTTSMLHKLLGIPKNFQARGDTVLQVLEDIQKQHPAAKIYAIDSQGKPKPTTLIFLNNQDIRFLKGLDTPISEGDLLMLITAGAGG